MAKHEVPGIGILGQLPAEVREMVDNEIFGPTRVITPMRSFKTALAGDQLLQPDVYIKAPVHTRILAASEKIGKEPLYMLFKDRTVRTSIVQFGSLLLNAGLSGLVRRIEVDDHFMAFRDPRSTNDTLTVLQRVLPQVCSTTILSDIFAFTQHNGRSYITVREFARMLYLCEAVCVDILDSVDDWSSRLSQRYLLADPSVHEDEAKVATLKDMRQIMGIIITSFYPDECNFLEKAARLRRTDGRTR